REYFEPSSVRDALYSRPPENVVDTPLTRRDMASFKASARSLDQGVGTVLNALDEHNLNDNTLVILTTDHGLAFPGAKATMFDRGLGVMLMLRGPGRLGGGRVIDSMVTHLDLYPTICELAGIDRPDWLEGSSLLPLVGGEVNELHDAIFAEVTFHAAYEPQRAVRTNRYKYVTRFDQEHPGHVLSNLDDGPTKELMLSLGWAGQNPPAEALYDVLLDPTEGENRISDPTLDGVAEDLRARLHDWMERTDDPLLEGPVRPAPGTIHNSVDQISADEPTVPPTANSTTHTRRERTGAPRFNGQS
ncbi:MAG: sulfatase/phosphatase domain-containing protein, partial [Solirubrobacterales bacterium]